MSTAAELVAELRALRRGRGLALAKLGESPALLDALGTTNQQEAYDRLVVALNGLGDSIQARALRNAYGVGMSDPRNLTVRRSDFAQFNQRHMDTIEAYENEALDELAALLEHNQPVTLPEDFVMQVTAAVEQRNVVTGIATVIRERDDSIDDYGAPVLVEQWEPKVERGGAPCIVYQLPANMRPAVLYLAANFVDLTEPPQHAFAMQGPSLFDLMSGQQPAKVGQLHNLLSAIFEEPEPGNYYSLFWYG